MFLPGDKVPETGQIFSNPDPARTLRIIAEQAATRFIAAKSQRPFSRPPPRLAALLGIRGSGRVLAGMGGTNLHRLPRLENFMRASPNGQGMAALENAEHHGAVRAGLWR